MFISFRQEMVIGRCWTAMTERGNFPGSMENSFPKAVMPPADAPITMQLYLLLVDFRLIIECPEIVSDR